MNTPVSRGAWVIIAIFGSIIVVAALLPSSPPSTPSIPALTPYVNDLTDPPTLISNEFNALDDACRQLDLDTTAELAILIVNTTQPSGIDRFASDTFAANGIGKTGKDNGVLVVVSMDEGRWRIEVGYGLEDVLNDAKVGRIGRAYLAPNLTTGQYYDGLSGAVSAIGDELYRGYDPGAPVRRASAFSSLCVPAILIFFLAALVIGVAVALYMRRHPGLASRISNASAGSGTTTTQTTTSSIDLSSFSSHDSFGGGRSGGGGAGGGF